MALSSESSAENKPANLESVNAILNDNRIHNYSNNNYSDVRVDVNLREIFLIIMRHSRMIAGIILCIFFLAGTFLLISMPRYTAESVLQINVQKNNVVNIESVMSGITSDESLLQSQLDILKSRNLAGKVVDVLRLVKDPEFSPQISKSSLTNWVIKIIKGDLQVEERNKEEELAARSLAISNILENLRISRIHKSYTIVVKFTSQSPKKSALIANTFVDEYLKGQLSIKFNATRRANVWLTDKLIELKAKVRNSEILVQAFREKYGLIETLGRTITDQQLSELNSQLILARTEKAQAIARLRGIGDGASSSDVLNSRLIQNLSGQEAQVLRKRSDLSSQYGPKHPKMINVNAELIDLRAKIDVEIKKVKASLENEVNISEAREMSLKKSLDDLRDKSGLSTKARIDLDELERQKEANKSLYESFLARSKETSEGLGLEQSDAFVISEAEIPQRPSYPNKLVVMILALFFGACIAVLVVAVLEHLDNAISSSKQVEEVTGINSIGMIPQLEKGVDVVNYLIKRPSSVFSESLRSILTSVHFSNPDNVPKILMVTSSVPKEGKSSFSVSVASLASKSGKKVLLIDADMKRPTIAKHLKREFEFGLSDLLAGNATESQVICRDEKSELDFIPSHPNTVNSLNLLGSNKMKEFLGEMRGKYDMVVIDTPPVMAISDCMALAGVVDTTLFVVRWQKTPREIIKSAVKQLNAFNVNIAGVVITRVDMDKQSKYSYSDKGNYYRNYSEYYSS